MVLLIRFILITLIIYLIIRSFARYARTEGPVIRGKESDDNSRVKNKGVSKEIGEYIDYEEIEK